MKNTISDSSQKSTSPFNIIKLTLGNDRDTGDTAQQAWHCKYKNWWAQMEVVPRPPDNPSDFVTKDHKKW